VMDDSLVFNRAAQDISLPKDTGATS
jgi:hypothetical protein